MLTIGELRARPERVRELGGADVLVAVSVDLTLAPEDAPARERLARLSHGAALVPLRKKPESFWDQVTVGRAPTCDVVLVDPAVSNVHAHFELGPAGRVSGLVDLGSSNGTIVEGRPITAHVATPVKHGQYLRFGESAFCFVEHESLSELLG